MSAIILSVINKFDDPVQMGSSGWHIFFFLLGIAVGACNSIVIQKLEKSIFGV